MPRSWIAFLVVLCSCRPPGPVSDPQTAAPFVEFESTVEAEPAATLDESSPTLQDVTSYTPKPAEFADMCEALFRHQFEHNASAVKKNAAAYFLTIERRDPDAAFLERFRGETPPIRPGSQFRMSKGVKFQIDAVRWIGPDTVEAAGGYYEAPLSSSGNVYRLERVGGKWKVTSDVMKWIS